MLRKGLLLPALLAVAFAALPARAGTVILHADDVSLARSFVCGEGKKTLAAGRYGLEVTYEPTPTPHSVLVVTKGGAKVCDVAGSPTALNNNMATTKTRLFTRVDNDRNAIEIVVITPTDMRASVKNQVFYIPLAASK